eukprot:gene19170-21091_t
MLTLKRSLLEQGANKPRFSSISSAEESHDAMTVMGAVKSSQTFTQDHKLIGHMYTPAHKEWLVHGTLL